MLRGVLRGVLRVVLRGVLRVVLRGMLRWMLRGMLRFLRALRFVRVFLWTRSTLNMLRSVGRPTRGVIASIAM